MNHHFAQDFGSPCSKAPFGSVGLHLTVWLCGATSASLCGSVELHLTVCVCGATSASLCGSVELLLTVWVYGATSPSLCGSVELLLPHCVGLWSYFFFSPMNKAE